MNIIIISLGLFFIEITEFELDLVSFIIQVNLQKMEAE